MKIIYVTRYRIVDDSLVSSIYFENHSDGFIKFKLTDGDIIIIGYPNEVTAKEIIADIGDALGVIVRDENAIRAGIAVLNIEKIINERIRINKSIAEDTND